MKKIVQIKIVFFLGVITLLTYGCKKDGATGPQGPAGPTGNANVVSTNYSTSSWPYSSPYYYCNLSVPALTSTNVNSAAVMVYFNTGNGIWNALPYTQYHSPSDYYMGFNTSAGNVQVTWVYDSSLSTGSDPNTFYGATVQVKVVVIPPAMIKSNVNLKNYNDVKMVYKLKD